MKIAVIGYYGHNNLGDELNLLEMLKLLKRQKEDAEITVFSGGLPYLYYETEYPLVLADPLGLEGYRRALNTFDLIIIGGGGLVFLGANYFNFLLEGVTAPYIFSRVGIDARAVSEAARRELGLILSGACDVTVRTAQDSRLANEYFGLSCDAVPEAIWNYRAEPFRYVYGGKILLVDINRYAANFAQGLSSSLSGLQTPHTICTLSMQDMSDDAYYNVLSTPRRLILPDAVSLHKKASFLGAADIVVTSRLHAGLVAISHGVPAILLKSTPKVKYLAEELELGALYFDRVPESAEIDDLLGRREALRAELSEKAGVMREKAAANLIRS
ncbi:MAG TPA: polysaccharide pyruvyl transferase family protein [Candidatus Acidoferrum sp.]|nr:polysaccharide pyruvyl transferase family protein [Candidatus Acidoferrum sp.]